MHQLTNALIACGFTIENIEPTETGSTLIEVRHPKGALFRSRVRTYRCDECSFRSHSSLALIEHGRIRHAKF